MNGPTAVAGLQIPSPPMRGRYWRARPVAVLVRRLPFTMTVALIMLVGGVASGSLWRAAVGAPWFAQIAYGLPALAEGRWWAPVSGAFFALEPVTYLPMVGRYALLVGFAEWRLGTARTVTITVLGHLVGVLGAAAFLGAVRDVGWAWAEHLGSRLDVGFSAGALAALAVVSAVLRPPWRLRVRMGLGLYLVVAFFFVGSLADVEHLVAVGPALVLGPRLTRKLGQSSPARPSRREWRLVAAAGLLLVGVITVVVWFLPGDGPLGSTAGQTGLHVLVTLVAVVLLVNGLRQGRRSAWIWAGTIAGLNVAIALLIPVLLAVATILEVPYTMEGMAVFVVDRLIWTALLVVLIAGRRAFGVPPRGPRATPAGTDRTTALELLRRSGGSALSWMSTWPGNSYFLTEDGRACIAYQRHAGVAIAVGDPVGPPATRGPAVASFARMCERAGLVPCLFSATEETARAATGAGWRHVQVAEDAIVDLPDLEFRGRAWQDVRSALNRAGKEGVTFRLVTLADQRSSLLAQVRGLSEQWVSDKGLPEMGFTLGGVDEALDRHVRVGLAEDADGMVHGVTSWLPVYGAGGRVVGWTLDLMRRRRDGFRPVVEFLIASSCLAFQAEDAAFVSLSGAPLARTAGGGSAGVLDRLLDNLGGALEPLYGFRSLHAFKSKFRPCTAPLYLAYRDGADLPRIGVALIRAYLPHAPLWELVSVAMRTGRGRPSRAPAET